LNILDDCNDPIPSCTDLTKYYDGTLQTCVPKLSFGKACTYHKMCDNNIGLSCSDNGCDCNRLDLYWNGNVCATKADFCVNSYELTCGSCLKPVLRTNYTRITFTHPSIGPPPTIRDAVVICNSTTYPANQLMVVRNEAQFLYLKSKTNTNNASLIWVSLATFSGQWKWMDGRVDTSWPAFETSNSW
jgi:hypothetical protein